MGKQTDWTGGCKALYRTRGIHCLSSFKGWVNGLAHLRRPGRLVRIGEKSGRRTWYELRITEESSLSSAVLTCKVMLRLLWCYYEASSTPNATHWCLYTVSIGS